MWTRCCFLGTVVIEYPHYSVLCLGEETLVGLRFLIVVSLKKHFQAHGSQENSAWKNGEE